MNTKDVDTENAILVAARQVFITNGFAGTHMQEIANLAGVNKSLVHYYFRNKQKLFDRVFQNLLNTLMMPLFSILQKQLPVVDKIKLFVNDYIDTLNDNPHIPLFMLHELSVNKPLVIKFFQNNAKFKLEHFIKEAIANTALGSQSIDPRQLFVNFISMLVFPFVGKDIFSELFTLTPEQYREFLNERKKMLCQLINSQLQVP